MHKYGVQTFLNMQIEYIYTMIRYQSDIKLIYIHLLLLCCIFSQAISLRIQISFYCEGNTENEFYRYIGSTSVDYRFQNIMSPYSFPHRIPCSILPCHNVKEHNIVNPFPDNLYIFAYTKRTQLHTFSTVPSSLQMK